MPSLRCSQTTSMKSLPESGLGRDDKEQSLPLKLQTELKSHWKGGVSMLNKSNTWAQKCGTRIKVKEKKKLPQESWIRWRSWYYWGCLQAGVEFSSVAQLCLILSKPVDCSMPASLSITNSQSLLKLMSIESVMPSNHLILCPLLLPPSMFPTIRVCSNESVLCISWSKYWSFSFRISPSNEYSGLISFRMDQLDLLAV